jgi:hypothetical protein
VDIIVVGRDQSLASLDQEGGSSLAKGIAGVANVTPRSRDFWTRSAPSISSPRTKNGAETIVSVSMA